MCTCPVQEHLIIPRDTVLIAEHEKNILRWDDVTALTMEKRLTGVPWLERAFQFSDQYTRVQSLYYTLIHVVK